MPSADWSKGLRPRERAQDALKHAMLHLKSFPKIPHEPRPDISRIRQVKHYDWCFLLWSELLRAGIAMGLILAGAAYFHQLCNLVWSYCLLHCHNFLMLHVEHKNHELVLQSLRALVLLASWSWAIKHRPWDGNRTQTDAVHSLSLAAVCSPCQSASTRPSISMSLPAVNLLLNFG